MVISAHCWIQNQSSGCLGKSYSLFSIISHIKHVQRFLKVSITTEMSSGIRKYVPIEMTVRSLFQ